MVGFSLASFPVSVWVLLLLAGCVGHIALLATTLNWWYAHPLPRWVLGGIKKLHALLVLSGPVAFVGLLGPDHFGPLTSVDGWRSGLAGYAAFCCVVGLVVVPAVTAWRLLRPRPAVLLSNHTRTVDVAKELGYAPIGPGKYRHLTRLPGNEVFRVDLVEKTFCIPDLPAAWDGLTILHLTDLHFCGSPDRAFHQKVMELCCADPPDLVAITGDIVDSWKHHRWILPVFGRLRWREGAFAVLGNHDYWHDPERARRRLKRVNIRVLGNSWEQITVRGEPMVVIGNEGPWFRPEPDLSACPAGVFRFCLSHTPDNIAWARRHGIHLMLAGHNHGGQICLPVLGSIFVPSKYGRRYDAGSFHEPPTLLHVGRGLGGQHPVRYNCRPEVTRIVLRKGDPQA